MHTFIEPVPEGMRDESHLTALRLQAELEGARVQHLGFPFSPAYYPLDTTLT
jgi:hypothetical protein